MLLMRSVKSVLVLWILDMPLVEILVAWNTVILRGCCVGCNQNSVPTSVLEDSNYGT